MDSLAIRRSEYQELTKAHYNAVAKVLPDVYEPLFYDDLLGMVISQIKCPSGSPKVLDLGCGYGRFIPVLETVGITDFVGLDYSPNMIEEGRRQYPNADLRVGDMCALSETFEPSMFDAVFAIASIMHVLPEKMPQVVEGLRLIMKSGAIGFVATPAGTTEEFFKPQLCPVPLSSHEEYMFRAQWTQETLGNHFTSGGFEIIEPTHVYYNMLYLVIRAV